jgi:hypothetical protein
MDQRNPAGAGAGDFQGAAQSRAMEFQQRWSRDDFLKREVPGAPDIRQFAIAQGAIRIRNLAQ